MTRHQSRLDSKGRLKIEDWGNNGLATHGLEDRTFSGHDSISDVSMTTKMNYSYSDTLWRSNGTRVHHRRWTVGTVLDALCKDKFVQWVLM